MKNKPKLIMVLLLLASTSAFADSSFLDFDEDSTPAPAAPAPKAQPPKPVVRETKPLVGSSTASTQAPKFECTKRNKNVTLTSIAANPNLAANLKNFMSGVDFKEGETYTRQLEGQRKNPAACAGLFGSIDLQGCMKYKPAGVSQFHVENGVVQYMADARDGVIPVNLTQVCSDGVSHMRFQFFYHKTFLTVTAGPWLYTIDVIKKDGQTYSNIVATVYRDGEKPVNVSMNREPIKVGHLEVASQNGRRIVPSDIEPTSASR